MLEKQRKKNNSNRLLYSVTFIGFLPLVCIFILSVLNQHNTFLNAIYFKVQNLPAITSSYNLFMTRIMDLYCKGAPLLALFIFALKDRSTLTIETKERDKLLTAAVCSPFLYGLYIYFFLFNNIELMTAGRPINLVSENNFTLLIFYCCLYFSSLFMTYGMCYVPVLFHRLLKQR